MTQRGSLSPRTRQAYARETGRFIENFRLWSGGRDAREARAEGIRDYLNSCYPSYVDSRSRLTLHVAAVKAWYWERTGIVLDVSVPRAGCASGPRELTDEQLEGLFNQKPHHVCGIILAFIFQSGARLSEALKVRVGDVDFNQCRVRLRGRDDEPSHLSEFPRSMKYALLREAHRKSPLDFLFSVRCDEDGRFRPVASRTVQMFLNSATRELGLEGVTAHTLRENFIMRMLRRGVDARKLRRMTGYKHLRSIVHYRELIPESEVRLPRREFDRREAS